MAGSAPKRKRPGKRAEVARGMAERVPDQRDPRQVEKAGNWRRWLPRSDRWR